MRLWGFETVALAIEMQQHAAMQTSRQQVAWDLGKQHALHLVMESRRGKESMARRNKPTNSQAYMNTDRQLQSILMQGNTVHNTQK